MITLIHVNVINEALENKVIRITDANDFTADGYTYLPVLQNNLTLQQSLFSATGGTYGGTSSSVGNIVLSNQNGLLDEYSEAGFDGQEISIYKVETKTTVPSIGNLVFRGIIFTAQFSWDEITLDIKNRTEELAISCQEATFLGSNAGPVGLEGLEDDIKGKVKPQVWGIVLNAALYSVNRSLLIYGCNYSRDGERLSVYSIPRVLDKGGLILNEGDVADSDLLIAATVAPGYYKTCLSEGLIKLGTVPKGAVTADIFENQILYCSASSVVKRILEAVGFIAGPDFDSTSLTALETYNSHPIGYYVTDDISVSTVISDILGSIGSWIVPDRLGIFYFGRIAAPDSLGMPAVLSLDINTTKDASLQKLPTEDKGYGVPSFKLEFNHSMLWQTLNKGEVLESLTPDEKEALSLKFRSETITDLNVKIKHKLSTAITFDSYLVDTVFTTIDPQGLTIAQEAQNRFDVVSNKSSRYKLEVDLKEVLNTNLGSIILFTDNRFNLQDGLLFIIIGKDEDHNEELASLDIWRVEEPL